jgi:DNA-binding response OmpR family regulator
MTQLAHNEREELARLRHKSRELEDELKAYRDMYADDAANTQDAKDAEKLRPHFRGCHRAARLLLVRLYRRKTMVTHAEIHSWFAYETNDLRKLNRILLVYVSHLRAAFRDRYELSAKDSVQNVWGSGYRLAEPACAVVRKLLAPDLG